MSARAAVLPLVLSLLAEAAVPPQEDPWPPVGVRHVVLTPDAPPSEVVEVSVSPGRLTTLLFDSPVAGVEVDRRERFQRVRLMEDSLQLMPSSAVTPGERLRVTVRFAEDGALPGSAAFLLVAHPVLADAQVEVSRQRRTPASYLREAQEAQAAERQCRRELEGLRREQHRPEGLAGLVVAGLLGKQGIAARDIAHEARQRGGEAISMQTLTVYRSSGWVALEVEVRNTDAEQPWTAVGAVLVGREGAVRLKLTPWQEAPLPPGQIGRVLAQAVVPREVRGTFVLSLWDADGRRTVTLRNVSIP